MQRGPTAAPPTTGVHPDAVVHDSAVVHASAVIDAGVRIGARTKIWHFAHVCAGASVGSDCVLGHNVFVGERVPLGNRVRVQNNVSIFAGVRVGNGVFLGPSCVFTNVVNPRADTPRRGSFSDTVVADGVSVGANATIVCGHTLGEFAFVGAGAVVTRDVAPYQLVVGNPARPLGWMCRCGERLPNGPGGIVCPSCGAGYHIAENSCEPTPAGGS